MKKKIMSCLIAVMLVTGISAQTVLADDIDIAQDEPVIDTPTIEEAIKDADWGATYENPVEVAAGKVVQLPDGSDLVKEGYRFVGWNTDPNATVGFFEYKMPNENTTLYAIWVPEEETTLCTCKPVDGVHQEGCPFYEGNKPAAPEAPVTPVDPVVPETPQNPEVPTEKPEEGTQGEQKPDEQGSEVQQPNEKPVEKPSEKPQENQLEQEGNKPDEPENVPTEPQGGNTDKQEPPVEETEKPAEPSEPEKPEKNESPAETPVAEPTAE